MSIKYVAFDVETPNHMNNRICSIGITTIDDTGRIETEELLVNPECDFDEFNISLTGITPNSVKNAPTFPEIWGKISPIFSDAILVAHNAPFDLSVLHKTLAAYNLQAIKPRYLCTMKMAKKTMPCIENHKLPTLCNYFEIPLEHHHAGSDSLACALVLTKLLSNGIELGNFISECDLTSPVEVEKAYFRSQSLSKDTLALNEMNTILQEISCDDILTVDEINRLICWMNDNISLRGNFPYDRIYDKLVEVLDDGVITEQEHDELVQLFHTATNPVDASSCPCDCINIEGKNVCLSGEFDYGSKDDVSKLLIKKGAIMQSGITKKTNILIVGGQGSSAWSAGNYGSKIKKALELQTKGSEILIIREADFLNSIAE